jgi:hypothetical protein
MPGRRQTRRRLVQEADPGVRHALLHGGWIGDAAARDACEARGGSWLDVLMRALDEPYQRQLWAEVRGDELPAWIKARPGSRPWAWWQYSAPEQQRQQVGGGRTYGNATLPRWEFGLPTAGVYAVDANHPPIYESEAAYLHRHGLLEADERRRLQPEDFEPVVGGDEE